MNNPAPLVAAARVLLALMFVLAGFSKLTGLEGTAGYIASKGLPMASLLALAVGFKARYAAGALAAFTLLASLLFHNFWAMPDGQAMVNQLMFMKNLAVAGGLLLVVAYGAGSASIDARRLRPIAA